MLKQRNHVHKVQKYMLVKFFKKLTDNFILFVNIDLKRYEDISDLLKAIYKINCELALLFFATRKLPCHAQNCSG